MLSPRQASADVNNPLIFSKCRFGIGVNYNLYSATLALGKGNTHTALPQMVSDRWGEDCKARCHMLRVLRREQDARQSRRQDASLSLLFFWGGRWGVRGIWKRRAHLPLLPRSWLNLALKPTGPHYLHGPRSLTRSLLGVIERWNGFLFAPSPKPAPKDWETLKSCPSVLSEPVDFSLHPQNTERNGGICNQELSASWMAAKS